METYSDYPLIQCKFHGKELRFYRKNKSTVNMSIGGFRYGFLATDGKDKGLNCKSIADLVEMISIWHKEGNL